MTILAINTPRLNLIPLSQDQLYLIINERSTLETRLNVTLLADIISEPLYPIIRAKIQKMVALSVDHYGWITYWLITLKTDSLSVGLIGCKGIPNLQGEVEIGYGISPTVQGQGYMTEAVQAFSDWALQAENCHWVTAQTDLSNIASQRVLQKVGFSMVGQKEDLLQWCLSHK